MKKFFRQYKNFVHASQGVLAEIYYGLPYKKLKFIAVTGTDGKTTTTQLIEHILQKNNFKVAYLSTISAKINGMEYETGLHVTSPDPWILPKFLRLMVQKNVEFIVLEVTSQGLVQNRTIMIPFDASVITNIKSDHLDYHGTWENYAEAKFKIIENTMANGLIVLNKDDEKSAKWLSKKLMITKTKNKILSWISESDISSFEQNTEGMEFDYEGQHFKIPLIGKFNIDNVLAAIKVAQRYLPLEAIAQGLLTFTTPIGRMEVVSRQPGMVIIDFAHTPNALLNALKTVSEIKPPNGKIICVYGCAGKRDKARRQMGAISAKLADISILTAEDPRDEKLKDINSEIFDYAKAEGAEMVNRFKNNLDYKKVDIAKIKERIKNSTNPLFYSFDEDNINSRIDAIDFALRLAQKHDVVYLTGKAHEKSLVFGEDEKPWSEHEVVSSKMCEIL